MLSLYAVVVNGHTPDYQGVECSLANRQDLAKLVEQTATPEVADTIRFSRRMLSSEEESLYFVLISMSRTERASFIIEGAH